jgi:DnaK suppressor protein
MTKSGIRALKASLKARQAAIGNNASKREDIAVQQAPDAFDEVQLNTERDLTITLLNHESALFQNLEAALRRIDDGSYGTCVRCQEEISAKRLKAVPWAKLCLRCQEKSDLGHLPAAGQAGVDTEL